MYLLGYDIGSSSVKASLIDAATGVSVATDFQPRHEMTVTAPRPGWAEQDPAMWWRHLQEATHNVLRLSGIDGKDIAAIGISYQMHGLVTVDQRQEVLRPAIIWCDSRAVPCGERAFRQLGQSFCLDHLLNSPGNFTAAKLAWLRENETSLFERIHKVMLPGDYIAMKLTGEVRTTASGLSEGIFWDYRTGSVSQELLAALGIPASMLADLVPTFGVQGYVTPEAASLLGLKAGTPLTYRAGDQPNNALSLNVLNPGEIAATAGTSGAVYGVSDHIACDWRSRVNTFLHVNHTAVQPRLGVLLCINGAGSLMSWMKHNVAHPASSYAEIDLLASEVPVGSEGVSIIPFGNGAERILENRETGASFHGINFYTHDRRHLLRAAQEGVAFAFQYGIDIMRGMGMDVRVIRAGNANMFKSGIFRQTLANATGAVIEMFDTDGSAGAARGAGIGAGIYPQAADAFTSLTRLETVAPADADLAATGEAYARWKHLQQLD